MSREEVLHAAVEVVVARVVEAATERELGGGIRRERDLQPLGVRERDLLVVAARGEKHRNPQASGRRLG